MDYVNVILTSYPRLDKLILGYKECVSMRCRTSCYLVEPVEKTFFKIYEKKIILEKLAILKKKIDILLSRLNEEERALIYIKYFDIKPQVKFGFSLRTYFRKQKKLKEKIKKYLSYLGIDEKSFEEDYMSISFFQMMKIRCEEIKRKNGTSSLEAIFLAKTV